jgi:glycosyltransferase involved in cell wall biosynthesis
VKVLHVSEAFGGGIVTSLSAFVKSTPEIEHHLLFADRPDDHVTIPDDVRFASLSNLPRHPAKAMRAIVRTFRLIKPDWVHLHSSYAGVYGRLSGLPKEQVIYSPHGYSFERSSSSPWMRSAFWAVERILSNHNGKFVGVSKHELSLARNLNKNQSLHVVPNVYDGEKQDIRSPGSHKPIRVVCVGRLGPQKDPRFLSRALQLLAPELRSALKITWVGGGDIALGGELIESGVAVTGWATRREVEERLREGDLYLHTAAWEGFPMSVVEAAALGCPILARHIQAFDELDLPAACFVQTPHDLALRLADLVMGKGWEEVSSLSLRVRERHTVEAQASALRVLYGPPSADVR